MNKDTELIRSYLTRIKKAANCGFFLFVRPAWVQSIGCKSRTVKAEVTVA
jgi:hypothetical protein